MRTALAGLLTAALLAPSIAATGSTANPKEGAFGFTRGMTLKQVRAVAKIEKAPGTRSSYATKKPPAPVGVKEADVEDITNALLAKYGRPGRGHISPDSEDRHSLSVWWGRLGPGSAIWLSVRTDFRELTRSVTVTYDFGDVDSCRAEGL